MSFRSTVVSSDNILTNYVDVASNYSSVEHQDRKDLLGRLKDLFVDDRYKDAKFS